MSESSMDVLVRRMEALEAANRRWKVGGAAAAALLAVAVAFGPADAQEKKKPGGAAGGPAGGPPVAGPTGPPGFKPWSKELKAEKIVLVDDKGKEKAVLLTDEGQSYLKFPGGDDGDEGLIIIGPAPGKTGGMIMMGGLDLVLAHNGESGTLTLLGESVTPCLNVSIDKKAAKVALAGGLGPGLELMSDEKGAHIKIKDADGKEVYSKP